MSSLDWRQEYRQATEHPPAHAKHRVWRAMTDQRSTNRRLLAPAFAAAAVATVALVLVLAPRPQSGPRSGEGYVLVATSARYTAEDHLVTLDSGRLAVSVWGAPLVVKVRQQRVELESALAVLTVAGDRVEVTPVEGQVLIDGEPVTAPRALPEAEDVRTLLALEPPEAPLVRAEARALAAVDAQAWSDAVAAWSVVAASDSLRAEVALVRRGELELRHLAAPARARATFDEAAARFPTGALAMERSLSALEAAAALSDWPDVERRALAFETDFPHSERLAEVRRARASALYALDRLDAACALAATLPARPPFAAACRSFER